MEATVVLAWLADVYSSSLSPSSQLIRSPPSPAPPPSRASRQRPRRSQTRHAASMSPRRRSPRQKGSEVVEDAAVGPAVGPAAGPLQVDCTRAALDKLDDDTTAAATASKNPVTRTRSLFSQELAEPALSEPSGTHGPTSLPSALTGSSRTRSQTPMKQVNDLLKLDIPVYWRDIPRAELHRRLDDRGSAGLLQSISSVLRKGYLPLELRDILDPELGLDDSDDMLYAQTPPAPIADSQRRRAALVAGAMSGSLLASPQRTQGGPAFDNSLSSFIHLQPLLSELDVIEEIVATTQDYSNVPRAEASWNERIHGRMLDLAVSHTPSVGVENVTRADIAEDFLPPTSARHMAQPATSKLIDYAMVVKPSPTLGDHESHEKHDGSKKLSLERIVHFVDMLDYPSFNQSSYSPLCSMPSGVFIKTNVNTHESTEAKAQLGMWLASWFGRVSEFPDSSDHDGRDVLPSPVLPALLVDGASWELYFAFDAGSHYDVCGRVGIGSTHSLDEAYRLLAVLRILAKWMETDFRAWVEECFRRAGV
ncbi:hypothetical protein F5Y18DRAFT_404411 [Xylariaceae sp. FL1019]|nr:hypothetical protein F5Y18DRAFT_404411 [Xylariaceae sp. FL1019]